MPVTRVTDVTGAPEILGGRVKTLHPKIHGGLLGRRGTDDAAMAEHGGTLGSFEDALRQTHLDMASDTLMIRKRRAERRQPCGMG